MQMSTGQGHDSQEAFLTSDDRLCVAYCAMQGSRPTMEDAHTIRLDFLKRPNAAFVGVYDGHGGQDAAKFSSDTLHEELSKRLAEDPERDIKEALEDTFLAVDDRLKADSSNAKFDLMGTTAAVALIFEDKVIAAGVGDTRVILATDGQGCVPLTIDHKPNVQEERNRIESAGGIVIFGRTNGTLAITRALGDFAMKDAEKGAKERCVIAVPEIKEHHTSNLDFVLVACDGVWDVLSNQEAVDFVYNQLKEESCAHPEEIVIRLAKRCLVSRDNVTVVLVVNKRRFPAIKDVPLSPEERETLFKMPDRDLTDASRTAHDDDVGLDEEEPPGTNPTDPQPEDGKVE